MVAAGISTLEVDETRLGAGVRLRDVEKSFGEVRALERLSFDISPGEFVSIIGPSGCGKSTLLRMIAGLEQRRAGMISFSNADAESWSASAPRIAFVFQDAHLLPWRNVLRNVALPLELSGVARAQRDELARRAIEQVGLTEALRRYPNQLSGGMKMRVSLARALVTRPELLLLDEPFAALDEITRQRLDEQLRELWRSSGMTVIFVTHSINEAAYLSERALVLSRRPGRVVMDHRIELPRERPALLRGDAAFAREVGVLLAALERGEEMA